MPFEIRAVEPDELDDLLTADQRGFGGEPLRPGTSRSWATGELDRTRMERDVLKKAIGIFAEMPK